MNLWSRLESRPWTWALLILVVVGTALYYKPLSGAYAFTGPDSLAPAAVGRALNNLQEETGELPLWQPWTFSGMPTLHAFTGTSRLYLPEFITRIFTSIGLPVFWVFLLHLVFAGLGSFVLLLSLIHI